MRYWLQNLRKQRNINKSQMARLMDVSRQQYSFIESGERQADMNLSTATKIAEIFNITLDKVWEFEQKERARHENPSTKNRTT